MAQCRELVDRGEVTLAFSGQYFCDGDYRAILSASRDSNVSPPVILASRRTPAIGEEAIHFGAFDVIGIPYRPTDVEWMILKARRNRQAAGQAAHLVTPSRQQELLVRHAS